MSIALVVALILIVIAVVGFLVSAWLIRRAAKEYEAAVRDALVLLDDVYEAHNAVSAARKRGEQ